MKRFWPVTVVVVGLFAGCLTTRFNPEGQAADVPRLTRVMHAAAIRKHYPCDTNLPPDEVKQLFAKAVDENPALELFERDLKCVKWCDGEVILLISNPKTGVVCFEDASCTPFLDRRWYETNCPPRTFTIGHPGTCGCK